MRSMIAGQRVEFEWDYRLVGLSYLCSVFGSWTSLLLGKTIHQVEMWKVWSLTRAAPFSGGSRRGPGMRPLARWLGVVIGGMCDLVDALHR